MREIERELEGLRGKGWTVSALADALGVSRVTVDRWRRGVQDPGTHIAVLRAVRSLERRKVPPKWRHTGKHVGRHEP